MSSLRLDLANKIYPEPFTSGIDHFDRLPDSLLLLIFKKIGDVKALDRCCVVSRRFHTLRNLRIELPSGELRIDDGVLLKWKADFGSTLDNCVILGASSVIYPGPSKYLLSHDTINDGIFVNGALDDNGSIPKSYYTNGGLKLRVVWTISLLIAASARYYLLQLIIAEHKTLDNLVLIYVDRQGVLCMNRDQLEELRAKPLSTSSASKRAQVPALNMRLWYAHHVGGD